MFKYGKGTYVMLLSAADLGETIKQHEREIYREKEWEKEELWWYIGRNNQRTLAYVQSDNALLTTRIIIIHLENDQRPFNKPTRITQQSKRTIFSICLE